MSKSSSDSGDKAVEKAKHAASKARQSGLLDGIESPGAAGYLAFTLVYVLGPPFIFPITKPGGVVQTAVELFWKNLLPHAASVPKDRVIPALATIYATFTFGISGALSVAGLVMGQKETDLNHPRRNRHELRGMALRLTSAHDHLLETFPMWAIAATLAQVLAPRNQQIINILGLAVLSRLVIHYPSYLLSFQPTRSPAHLIATAASTAALYALATGAR